MGAIITGLTTNEKLNILADAAKYDVACTSSGVDRKGEKGALGNSVACGICHSFSSDGRCISLLKVLMTNHCIYDCKYCVNRRSNDVPRAAFEADELCDLVIEFYKRNYIEGLFLSSGVIENPTYTMERMCSILYLLRTRYRFNGYIHVKTIPGASDELISMAGYLADRISVNMELPTDESLRKLAPNKSFCAILDPMSKITNTIGAHRIAIGKPARMERSGINRYLPGSIFNDTNRDGEDRLMKESGISITDGAAVDVAVSRTAVNGDARPGMSRKLLPYASGDCDRRRDFAPAGQSTQMIVGAGGDSDYTIIHTAQSLYQDFDLKRVFYSAYIPVNEDPALPPVDTAVPLLREHRLYQADWLMRYYGFRASDIVSESEPYMDMRMDPKCNWAVRHLELFPVEVQTAQYDMLLKVPGIGPKSAGRIVRARRYGSLTFDSLKKMGVVLKRAHYFITCGGHMMYRIPMEKEYIVSEMVDAERKESWQFSQENRQYRQLTLFDDQLQNNPVAGI